MRRVLVIGGYGNFGSFICQRLACDSNVQLVIGGRSRQKSMELAKALGAEGVEMDIHRNLAARLREIRPDIVIHTSGPFQQQGYDVAHACIECGAHYIDLADGREFVAGIDALDAAARRAGVCVVSGASSVPCLSSALLDDFHNEFAELDTLEYGITTAQKTTRGLATTAAILGYAGQPFKTRIDGIEQNVYGWQGITARRYTGLGWRLLGYCNVPDLALFPIRYPGLKTILFYAGLELSFVHITLWALSWLVRVGIVRNLACWAPLLLKTSFLFDGIGSANSGFHLHLTGRDASGKKKALHFELIAKSGDGPFIPCMPAILLASRWASGNLPEPGAMPCMGMITKQEYLAALAKLDIHWTPSSQ